MEMTLLQTRHTIGSWWRCFWSIWKHKWYVYRGARIVGGVPIHRLLLHDLGKFHPREFFGYANKFYGADDNPDAFDLAWLHHQNHSDHHWEYWMIRGVHKMQHKGLIGIIEMPEACVREMISDWIGASLTYQRTPDMEGWLRKNLSKLDLHPETIRLVAKILKELGYKDAGLWFMAEG